MSTEVADRTDGTEAREADVTAQVATAIGDSAPAVETQATQALKWFEVVEIPEIGFRAFCRLPNDFQHKDIREKAMAAKARRKRALRHPGTDAYDMLEGDIEAIAEVTQARENIIEEILQTDYWKDREEAIQDVREEDEFELIVQDQERYRSMEAMEPDERPGDEWTELLDHLTKYSEAIVNRIDEAMKPRRIALMDLDLDVLLDRVRTNRINADISRAFMDAYSFWQIYAGTLEIPEDFDPENITADTMPRKRYFDDETALRESDPVIVERLSATFDGLENNLSSLTSGNS